jgi:hypothetical protein
MPTTQTHVRGRAHTRACAHIIIIIIIIIIERLTMQRDIGMGDCIVQGRCMLHSTQTLAAPPKGSST